MAIIAPEQKPIKHGILSLTIKDKAVLYAAYMPFLRNGGLFIPTNKPYEIGNDVFMLIQLLDEVERIPVAGTVAWVTPQLAQGNRASGVGIQFKDAEGVIRKKIENLLAGQINLDKPTHTL
jgi:type IV pilus assembly protein PilZ